MKDKEELSRFKNFSVSVYGELKSYNETISIGRCRIFYKYDNRNGSYITDEFADKLISSLPYTPIKGIYDNFEQDYTDHGEKRTLGRIYGIVPENPNFAWEFHLDEDGVTREYACCDVLLFTALYDEAEQILSKPQSMEIYEPSIKGEWKIINGERRFVFEDGCFLGLQILGDDTEPCFEGAAFFSLYSYFESIKEIVDNFSKEVLNPQRIGGNKMEKINFKLSDNEKHDAIWSLLNSNYNEENGFAVDYAICDIYDDYAIVFNYNVGSYERAYYTKADDSVTITSMKTCYMIDVTESELNSLNTIRALNGGTYEKLDENFNSVASQEEKNSEYEQQLNDKEEKITTLTQEKSEQENTINTLNQQIEGLNRDIAALNAYKMNVETKEKETLLDKYSEKMSEETISSYREHLADYTLESLDRELAYQLVQTNPSIFSRDADPGFVPKDEELGGIEEILAKYRK